MLHTCASGREGHQRYAPCTVSDLCSRRYDYWALGHVHEREILHEAPHVVFPGNLQGRHIREPGPKGAMLVTVAGGRAPEVEFRALDVLRWNRCTIDATGAQDADAIMERVRDHLGKLQEMAAGRALAVRVEIQGACGVHNLLLADQRRWCNEIRALAVQQASGDIWIEKVLFHTRAPHDHPAGLDGPLEELVSVIDEFEADESQLQQIFDELADLQRKLPAEFAQHDGAPRLDDPACVRELLQQVRPFLIGRLLGGERLQ
jgi:DNA repair exonuclease SbcCD nuclease subunit